MRIVPDPTSPGADDHIVESDFDIIIRIKFTCPFCKKENMIDVNSPLYPIPYDCECGQVFKIYSELFPWGEVLTNVWYNDKTKDEG